MCMDKTLISTATFCKTGIILTMLSSVHEKCKGKTFIFGTSLSCKCTLNLLKVLLMYYFYPINCPYILILTEIE